MFGQKQDYLKIEKIQNKALKIAYNSENHMRNCFYVATNLTCQLIKSSYIYGY